MTTGVPLAGRARSGAVPLLVVSVVVVLVAAGLARGIWLANLHNGLLAVAFALVGAYVLFQRPGHREGVLFMAAGAVEAVLFLGRQVGREPDANAWWGWLGVWPVAVGLALSTVAVICFPDGRLPSPRWRWVVTGIVAVAAGCAALSALWPVEYASAGVATAHPFGLPGRRAAEAVWGAVAHPAYAAFQLLWVPAVVMRWRSSGRVVRAQLVWVGFAVVLSAVALVVGLAVAGTPRAGLLTAALVPLAAGWAIIHGEHLAAYSALSWLSRSGALPQAMPDALARAAADALAAPRATLWMGPEGDLRAAGSWPPDDPGAPLSLAQLGAAPQTLVRPVVRSERVIGALSVTRPGTGRPSAVEDRVLDDLAAQAVLVIEHVALIEETARHRVGSDLSRLTARERQVLELMARGLSNAAICNELHLSVKTVEPVIGSIFAKLGLGADSASNRRVLAVLAFLRP